MKIAWIYLDKKAAAINALKDYASMEHILLSYSDDVAEACEHLTSIHSPVLTKGMTGTLNPRVAEERIVRTLDLIDVVKERYQRALEYMAWFRPAWDVLTDGERHLLSELYLCEDETQAEIIQRLCDELCVERAAVYRRKDKAAMRLALLLYGK